MERPYGDENTPRHPRDHPRRRRSRRLAPGDLSGPARVPRDAPRAPPRSQEDGGAASAGRSINLALANRGIAALEEVGVMESVRSELIPMAGRMLHDEEGRLRLIPYGNKPHEVIYSVSRAGLNTLLLDAAESTGRVSIRFGATVCGVDFADRQVRFLAEEDPERAERRPTTSSSGRTEAPRRFAPRSWNGRADGSTRSRSATGTRSSRSPRRPAADSGWRRTPCTSGREANTC